MTPTRFLTKAVLSLNAASAGIDAAVDEATKMSIPVSVVIVDDGGHTKALCRMDGSPLISIQTAVSKAYAAAAIGSPPTISPPPSSQTPPPLRRSRQQPASPSSAAERRSSSTAR